MINLLLSYLLNIFSANPLFYLLSFYNIFFLSSLSLSMSFSFLPFPFPAHFESSSLPLFFSIFYLYSCFLILSSFFPFPYLPIITSFFLPLFFSKSRMVAVLPSSAHDLCNRCTDWAIYFREYTYLSCGGFNYVLWRWDILNPPPPPSKKMEKHFLTKLFRAYRYWYNYKFK